MTKTVRSCIIAAVAVTALGLSSCSIFDAEPALVLGVTKDSTARGMTDSHAQDLATYYEYWLSEKKMEDRDEAREVDGVSVEAADRIDAVRDGSVDMVFGCTGEFIEMLDPHKADVLRELYQKQDNPDSTEWRDISNSTMLSILPAELATSIPGEVQGCGDKTLPQNLIAIYRKDVMTRDQRVAVNNATAGMSFSKSIESLTN